MSSSANFLKTKLHSNILFLGLGGAGQRHVRCIRQIFPTANFYAYRFTSKTPLLNKDFTVNNHDTVEKRYGITMLASLSEAKSLNADFVVIATPTNTHAELATEFASKGNIILLEKPAALTKSETSVLYEAIQQHGCKLFVSFQRFHDPALISLRRHLDRINQHEIQNISIKVSSDVRAWHPYEDYRSLYACRNELGGGVINTECHELAFILDIFGTPEKVKLTDFSNSHLGKVEDSAKYQIKYKNMSVDFDLTFLSEFQSREITVKFLTGELHLDLLKRELTLIQDGAISNIERFSEITQEQLYTLQIKDIFDGEYREDRYRKIVQPMATVFEILKSAINK